MLNAFEDMQKLGKNAVEVAVESLGTASKGAQTIAAETAAYARKSFEQGTSAMESLLGARSLERAVEVQSQYAKLAYEGMVAQSAKINEIFADVTKQSFKPVEDLFAKARPAAA